MVLAVIAADTHVSENTWTHSSRSAIKGDSFWGFRQLIDLCVEHNCPLVLGGDCLELARDTRPTTVTVNFLRSQIDRLANIGQKLYYILGQHDGNEFPSWLSAIHESCEHFGNKRIKIGSQDFYGVDFFSPTYARSVIADIPSDVFCLVVHGPWKEFTGANAFAELSLADFPNVPVIVSGDMHACMNTRIENRLCISPGATNMRTLREPVNHYCLLLEDNLTFKVTQLKSRPIINFTVVDANAWVNHLEDLCQLTKSTYESAMASGMPGDVAIPLVVVDVRVAFDGESIIKERLQSCHVVFKGAGDTGVSKAMFGVNDMVGNNEASDAIEKLMLLALDEIYATEVQKAICVGMSRGESVLDLLLHYA